MSLLISCRQDAAEMGRENLPAKNLVNVAYGKESLQQMDVYLPAGRSKDSTASIVLIHGGSWNAGSRKDFTAYIDSFKKRFPQHAIFNLDYRLYNGNNTFPTQEMDIQQALNFIAARQDEYAINADKLVLMGASAGGHLALLQAYKYETPKIAAVISFFGPTDLTSMYSKPWHPYVPMALQMVTGTSPDVNPKLYEQSSPIYFVSKSSAPTLMLHGSVDPVVHISQSKALQQELEKKGVQHELVIYPGKGHGWYGQTLSHSFDKIEAFLSQQLQ